MILPKNQMTEEDIKLQYITPAITAKWSQSKITTEAKITDGRINLYQQLAGNGDDNSEDTGEEVMSCFEKLFNKCLTTAIP